MGTVAAVADSDDTLNLVPAPADRDVFTEDVVLVEAVERHDGKAHLGKLRDLGRLAGAPRSVPARAAHA
jgi:putative acyl-CoA dehydrogenase